MVSSLRDTLDRRTVRSKYGFRIRLGVPVLSLANGVPFEGTFERVFKGICPDELEHCLRSYGQSILSELSEKQIVIDGKKKRDVSPTTRVTVLRKMALHIISEQKDKLSLKKRL